MADINIGSDQLLTTTLSDNDRVTITTAATGQQVATMTVGKFREILCGRDYSLLTEQVVPCEFWLDKDGNRKQVYVRTFVGTMPSKESFVQWAGTQVYIAGINLGVRFDKFKIIYGWVDNLLQPADIGIAEWKTIEYVIAPKVSVSGVDVQINNPNTSSIMGRPYVFTIKYIKA